MTDLGKIICLAAFFAGLFWYGTAAHDAGREHERNAIQQQIDSGELELFGANGVQVQRWSDDE